ASYAWDTGVAVTLEVPAVVADTTSPAQSTPRLGGNLSDHIEVAGAFRLWGDVYDYFAFKLGYGLPIASDDVGRNGVGSMLLLSAFGQLDWGWIDLKFNFTDNPTLPSINLVSNRHSTNYVDSTNFMHYDLTIDFYPSTRVSPYLFWQEVFPRSPV